MGVIRLQRGPALDKQLKDLAEDLRRRVEERSGADLYLHYRVDVPAEGV
jgi:hypothetical protein